MNRRVIAAVAAVVLALVGGGLLTLYVTSADRRAMANLDPVNVLVVMAPIEKGALGREILDVIAVKQLPRAAVAADAVSDPSEIADLETTTSLQIGEQILRSRFVDPEEAPDDAVDVPSDLQQISVLLDPERLFGARLKADDTVGVFVSYKNPDSTHQVAHKVLVTRVTVAGSAAHAKNSDGSERAPTDQFIVTLAVTAKTAEQIVFGQEHGGVWLSLERKAADETGTRVVDKKTVFEK
jgi:pilus assembly protein CpaB